MAGKKRQRSFNFTLQKLDYYLKQEEEFFAISELSDLISATSPSFYFKDVSDRTISMFCEGGWMASPFNDLFKAEVLADPSKLGYGQEQWEFLGSPDYEEGKKQTEAMINSLFPEGIESNSTSQEAAESFTEAMVTGGDYLDYSKSDIFPQQGILLTAQPQDIMDRGNRTTDIKGAGAIRIQRVDWKDPSKGFNVYRNTASIEGGRYSKTTPWPDNERVKLNDQPIHNYHNAYKTAKDSMIATSGDKGLKPRLSLGLGSQRISRQQRRNLIQKVEKKLASREKAIKKGVRDRTRQRWKDNAEQFLIELPQNAQNAAGEGIRALGRKALEAADRVKEYEDMFTEQAGAKIREGVEKAKPHVQKALQAVQREAENQFFNAQVTWESAKEFAREKAPIVKAVLHQARVKATPAWNAATKKGAQLTDKAMFAAGKGYAKAMAAREATGGFLGRMKSNFQQGYHAEMERQWGASPKGEKYQNDPQGYWESRSQLATDLGKAQNEYEKSTAKADRIENPDESNKAKLAAWDVFKGKRGEVEEGANAIGSSFDAVNKHVERIKSGDKTVLPPSSGWPTGYGGRNTINRLRKNVKAAGLQPMSNLDTGPGGAGEPQAPELRDVPPQAEAPQAEAAAEQPAAGVEQQGELPSELMPSDQPEAKPQEGEQLAMPQPGQQMPMPGMPDTGGSPENKAAAGIPSSDREYLDEGQKAPQGVSIHSGVDRAGKKANFYSKKESASKRQQGSAQAGGGPSNAGAVQGQLQMAGVNEMATPVDDYKQETDEAVDSAKRSQAKSKIRTAKATARMAKAKANEAEAKAVRSEEDSGMHIADILAKLDGRIATLNAHSDPKISSVLSKLEKTIKSIDRTPAIKK